MQSMIRTLGAVAAIASVALAQSTRTTSASAFYQTSDILAIASQYEGSATKSLSPSQVSALYNDINSLVTAWISAFPTDDPAVTDTAATGALFTSIEEADGAAETAGSAGLAALSSLVSGLPDAAAYLSYGSEVAAAGQSWTTEIGQILATDIGQLPNVTVTGTSSATSSSKTSGSSKGSSTVKATTSATNAASSSATTAATASSSGMAAAPTSGSAVVVGALAAAAGVVGIAML